MERANGTQRRRAEQNKTENQRHNKRITTKTTNNIAEIWQLESSGRNRIGNREQTNEQRTRAPRSRRRLEGRAGKLIQRWAHFESTRVGRRRASLRPMINKWIGWPRLSVSALINSPRPPEKRTGRLIEFASRDSRGATPTRRPTNGPAARMICRAAPIPARPIKRASADAPWAGRARARGRRPRLGSGARFRSPGRDSGPANSADSIGATKPSACVRPRRANSAGIRLVSGGQSTRVCAPSQKNHRERGLELTQTTKFVGSKRKRPVIRVKSRIGASLAH